MRIYSVASNQSFGQKLPLDALDRLGARTQRVNTRLDQTMKRLAEIGTPRTPEQKAEQRTLIQALDALSKKQDALGSREFKILQDPSSIAALKAVETIRGIKGPRVFEKR